MILTTLHEQNPSISWSCEDGILVFKAVELSKLQNNPLDLKLAPFKFKGNLTLLLAFISSKIPDLSPTGSLMAWPGCDSEVYDFDFPSETTVRSILIKLARDYGISWTVKIADLSQQMTHPSKLYWIFSRTHPQTWHYKSIICDN